MEISYYPFQDHETNLFVVAMSEVELVVDKCVFVVVDEYIEDIIDMRYSYIYWSYNFVVDIVNNSDVSALLPE